MNVSSVIYLYVNILYLIYTYYISIVIKSKKTEYNIYKKKNMNFISNEYHRRD